MNSPTPTNVSKNTTLNLSLRKKQTEKELKKELDTAKNDDSFITYDTGVTLKSFIANINSYIAEDIFQQKENKKVRKPNIKQEKFGKNVYIGRGQTTRLDETKSNAGVYYIRPNAYIYQFSEVLGNQAWVRWGWFEDNILSKFLTLASDSDVNPFVMIIKKCLKIMNQN